MQRSWGKARGWCERDERRFALYAQGLIDRLIADVEGVDRATIGQWRRARSLPPNDSLYIRFAYANEAKQALMRERLRLIGQGWSDSAVADHQNRGRKTIRDFRRRRGIPGNKYAPPVKTPAWLDDGRPRVVSYEASFGDRYLADPSWSTWLEEMGATVW